MNPPLVIDNKLERAYLDQLVALDRTAYHQEPTRVSLDWAERRPEMYTILRRGDYVVGYGLVLPLRQAPFEALQDGNIWEDELLVSCLSDSSTPDGYYLASIVAVPNATARERAMIVGVTVGPLLRAPRETIAIPVSSAGERICHILQMQQRWSSLVLPGLDGYRPSLFAKVAEELQ